MNSYSCRIAPIFAYLIASALAVISWYGWTYQIVFYGDVVQYGPCAYVAGWITKPITGGLTYLPPAHPLTTTLLTWLMWFVVLRLGIVAWTTRRRSRP